MSNMRLQLHNELRLFYPRVYFQPPSNIKMEYPCIVYNRSNDSVKFADNDVYHEKDAYSVTLIEKDPDSTMAKEIRRHFRHIAIQNYLTVDSLHQTTLILYY